MDEPRWERAVQCAGSDKLAFWRAVFVNFGCILLRRTLDQIRRAFPCPCLHDVLSLRSHGATEDPPVSIPDGGRGIMFILSTASLDLGVYRVWLGLPYCRRGLNNLDYVVLPILSRRRSSHADDRCRPGRCLY